MKERPILFSVPMVLALLDGSKTQTRRVVKPQFAADAIPAEMGATNEQGHQISGHSGMWWCDAEGNHEKAIRCPYGQPGDRLWVRETFRGCRAYEVQGYPPKDWGNKPIWFEADGTPPGRPEQWALRSRPSIHMPRWASRITLEVTGVRVERLQDITRGDAMAEGCPFPNMAQGDDPRKWYAELWDRLNAKGRPTLPHNTASKRYARVKHWLETHPDTSSWDANPWVWVVEFRRAPC